MLREVARARGLVEVVALRAQFFARAPGLEARWRRLAGEAVPKGGAAGKWLRAEWRGGCDPRRGEARGGCDMPDLLAARGPRSFLRRRYECGGPGL